jgi:carbonic anhydrase
MVLLWNSTYARKIHIILLGFRIIYKLHLMKKIAVLALSLAFLFSCSKDSNTTTETPVIPPSNTISTKAELALLNFDLSHTSKKSGFPNLGDLSGQTPIDIPKETKNFESKDPVIHYERFSLNNNNIENHKGEYLKVFVTGENYITIRGKRYDLAQFHFHRNSEHALRGKKSAMELHLVHVSTDGKIAVLGMFIQETRRENEKLSILINNSPLVPNGLESIPYNYHPFDLLPKTSGKYYTYNGSLTTPNLDFAPNRDGLSWIVFDSPIHISTNQLTKYAEIYEENVRVLQPLAGRTVWSNPDYRLR